MKVRITVNPKLLTWARERAGLDTLALAEPLESGKTASKERPHE
jgi:hypothetical protein